MAKKPLTNFYEMNSRFVFFIHNCLISIDFVKINLKFNFKSILLKKPVRIPDNVGPRI